MSHQTDHPDCYDEHGRPLFDANEIEDVRIEKIREYCKQELALAQKRVMPGRPSHRITEQARRCRTLVAHLSEILEMIGDD